MSTEGEDISNPYYYSRENKFGIKINGSEKLKAGVGFRCFGCPPVDQVGGRDLDTEKSREVAEIATKKLREGTSIAETGLQMLREGAPLAEVHSIVAAWPLKVIKNQKHNGASSFAVPAMFVFFH